MTPSQTPEQIARAAGFTDEDGVIHRTREGELEQPGSWEEAAALAGRNRKLSGLAFTQGSFVYFGRGPLEFVGTVVSSTEDEVVCRGVELGCNAVDLVDVRVQRLAGLQIIDADAWSRFTENEPAFNTGELVEKRILAVFQPQMWQNDYAVEVDGRREVDVTEKVLRLSLAELIGLDDDSYDSDDLVDLEELGHKGPFYVSVKDQVAEFFGVVQLADVTQDMLDAARETYKQEQSTKLPSSTVAPSLLDGIENHTLIDELRRRGVVVSAWGVDDMQSTLENDEDTEDLTDEQFDALVARLSDEALVGMEDILACRGNEHIDDAWARVKSRLLAEVATRPMADAPSPDM